MKKTVSLLLALALVLSIFSICGIGSYAVDPVDGDFTYTVVDGCAKIKKYTGSAAHLVIPDTLGGYPVTIIGMTAFKANKSIISVVLPATVTTLEARAFANCYNLEEITIPSNVTSIGTYCFENTNIHKVYCDAGSAADDYFDNNYTHVEVTVFPKVVKQCAQVKMKATSATTVDPSFQLRIKSVITDEDWNAWFSQTGSGSGDPNTISCVGIIGYRGDPAAYDESVAKAVAESETNEGDYAFAKTNYVSKNANEDAYFGAIIKVNHETLENDIKFLGFVKYVDSYGVDQIMFYETTYTAAIVTNYDTIVTKYLEAFPYAA